MRLILVALLMIGGSSRVCDAAQQIPAVAVRFELGDRSYTTEYTAAEQQQIGTAVADELAKKLTAEIGFLRFQATTQGAPAEYTLTFALARRDKTITNRPDEVGFHAAVTGPQLQPASYYWVRFRPMDVFGKRKGKPAELIAEIKVVMASANVAALTKEVLSRIPIAKAGVHVPGNPPAWVLPFKRKDLCLDPEGSVFRVQNRIRTSLGDVTHTFLVDARGQFNPTGASAIRADRNSVLGHARPPQEGLDVLGRSSSGVEVLAVFVDRYQFNLGICQTAVDPAAAFRPGGLP